MGESLTQQRRVGDEVLWSVNPCKWGRRIDIRIGCLFDGTRRVSSGYSVPAAAVIRGEQALSGITGRKGRVGGLVSQM